MTNRRTNGKANQPSALVIGEIGLVSSLGEVGVPIIVGSETRENAVLYSRYANKHAFFSAYDTDKFIEELVQLGRTLDNRPVIFSDDDRAILNISEHRELLEPYYQLLYPSKKRVHQLLDKQSFIELAEQYDLPAPRSLKVSALAEIEANSEAIEFPCIVKPTQRHFWWGDEFIEKVGFYKKAIICENMDELVKLYQKIARINPSVVIQEYVAGGDDRHYSANLFVDRWGQIRGYYIARKLRIYPINAGNGTYIITVLNDEVLDICRDIIQKLELCGLVNIQFKQDSRTGKYKLMEIHARNSQWSLLGAKSGANLAHMYYRHLVFDTRPKDLIISRPGFKYFDLAKDVQAFLDYRKEGVLTFRQWRQTLKGDKVFVGLSAQDPWPMLIKMWYTIRHRIGNHYWKNMFKKRDYYERSTPVQQAYPTSIGSGGDRVST
ncbi:MAG: hypothetical protein ACQETE_08695 [Bacteroidota bacterium]